MGAVLVDLLAGAVVGVIGTMAHRMGASANIPYGLVIAYALVIISTWSARSRDGVSGLALHLISSSLVVWTVMAGYGPGGDAMIPVGFGEMATLPYFSNNAGYFWLYGVVLIPLIMLALPKSWFTMPPRTEDDSTEYDQNESSEPDHDTAQPVD